MLKSRTGTSTHSTNILSAVCLFMVALASRKFKAFPTISFPFYLLHQLSFNKHGRKLKIKTDHLSLSNLNRKTTIVATSLDIDPIVLLVAKKKRVSNDETIAQAIEPKKR